MSEKNLVLRSMIAQILQKSTYHWIIKSLTKSGFLRGVFQKFKERRGRGRAIVALAHKLLRVIYTLIKGNCCYKESDLDVMKKFRAKRLARAVRQAEYVNLGLDDGVVFDRTTGEVLAT